jgi:NAD-dependent DNA ligase
VTLTPVADLSETDAADELAALADELAAHDLRYHQQDAPTISDGECAATSTSRPAFRTLSARTLRP